MTAGSMPIRSAGSSLLRRADAWNTMFSVSASTATHAVTLAYNNLYGATASWCYRLTSDGEYLRLPTSSVPVNSGVNRLPTIKQVPLERVHADVNKLHYYADRKLYGSNFDRLPEHLRSSFIGMTEHAASNVHVHLIWTMPDEKANALHDIVAQRWKTITDGYGSVAVKALHDGDGWASYCLKNHVGAILEGDPLRFVSSAPARAGSSRP